MEIILVVTVVVVVVLFEVPENGELPASMIAREDVQLGVDNEAMY
jgi:hypothetical protein